MRDAKQVRSATGPAWCLSFQGQKLSRSHRPTLAM